MTEALLPGVGLRYEFTTAAGDRLGFVVRRGGDVEVVGYAPDAPRSCGPWCGVPGGGVPPRGMMEP